MFTNGLNITNKTITILEVRLTAKTAKGFFFVFWNIECIWHFLLTLKRLVEYENEAKIK